ncbi:hypothetical protein D3C78_1354830 [compost metagenome]
MMVTLAWSGWPSLKRDRYCHSAVAPENWYSPAFSLRSLPIMREIATITQRLRMAPSSSSVRASWLMVRLGATLTV